MDVGRILQDHDQLNYEVSPAGKRSTRTVAQSSVVLKRTVPPAQYDAVHSVRLGHTALMNIVDGRGRQGTDETVQLYDSSGGETVARSIVDQSAPRSA